MDIDKKYPSRFARRSPWTSTRRRVCEIVMEAWALATVLTISSASQCVMAQASVDELRNNYNFLQAGLSTLAAATSVALCLARGRLDSEMGIADFFAMVRLKKQNEYNGYYSIGTNGVVIGVHVGPGEPNPNTVMWARHNTWAQGSTIALVPLHIGPPRPVQETPTLNQVTISGPSSGPSPRNEPTESGPSSSLQLSEAAAIVSGPSSGSASTSETRAPQPECTCWHITTITSSSFGGAYALSGILQPTSDRQSKRVTSYQCALHGQHHLDVLHQRVQSRVSRGTPLISVLTDQLGRDIPPAQLIIQDSSLLFELMKHEHEQCTYFFGVDRIGARCLTRMVSESLVTLDASQKGRTSDLVEWSLGRLDLSEKPDIKWEGSFGTVLIVALLELLLMIVFSVVFGLDPFVSSLGARRGVRSLRLGPGGVTSFGDLWLLKVKAYSYRGWDTPILRVEPRDDMRLWYVDLIAKSVGLLVVWGFWIANVMGTVHPLGLNRNQAWGNTSLWTIYVGMIASIVGFMTCFTARPKMKNRFPGTKKDKGFGLLHWCMAECGLEIAVSILRLKLPHSQYFMRAPPHTASSIVKGLRRGWYVLLEVGIWMQWITAKRSLSAGPHSDSHGVPWERTSLLAGALARATILAAVSGDWK